MFNEVVVVAVAFTMIPIVAILSRHQQKMTEIIHHGKNDETRMELGALRQDVQELTHVVNRQTIMLDNLSGGATQIPPLMVGYREVARS